MRLGLGWEHCWRRQTVDNGQDMAPFSGAGLSLWQTPPRHARLEKPASQPVPLPAAAAHLAHLRLISLHS